MSGLRIAENLVLPQDIVTDTLAVLAIRGAGKTYTFLVLVEQMIEQRLPVLVLDMMGVCWGLRSSADGKGPGLPVVIIGGRHGDVPLEAGAGKVIADFVIAERQPIVLDISEFSKGEQLRFALDLSSRLFQANRDPLHIVIDESDDLAPQRPFREEARTLRAVEILVRRGRARGIGVTLVTQRPAVLNKNVLAMCSTLIVGRIIAPQDRRAVQAWIEARATAVQASTFFESLAGLPTKEKWVWGPDRKIFQRVTVALRKTFDSSATPKIGATRLEPKALAEVDLEGLKKQIAGTIERAKQEDPRELRREIAELRRQMASKVGAVSTKVENKSAIVEVPIIRPHELKGLQKSAAYLKTVWSRFEVAGEALRKETEHLREMMTQRVRALQVPQTPRQAFVKVWPKAPVEIHRVRFGQSEGQQEGSGTIRDKCQRAVMTVLVQQDQACQIGKLALLAGYRVSGGFRNALSGLRTAGYLDGPNTGYMVATAAGKRALGVVGSLPNPGDGLIRYWLNHPSIKKCEQAILSVLVGCHPTGLEIKTLAEKAGYEVSGGFRNSLSTLRTAGLIVGRNTEEMRASDALF